MFRLMVIPEVGNSAASKCRYPTIENARADGHLLAKVIFGDRTVIPRLNDETMEAHLAARISAMMLNESGPAQDPKILEMFSASELEGLIGLHQPSVRLVVTDESNLKHLDHHYKRADFS